MSKSYEELADELDVLGAGTPEAAAPEVIGESADALRELAEKVKHYEAHAEARKAEEALQRRHAEAKSMGDWSIAKDDHW